MSLIPSLDMDPVEDPDWDYARVRRVLVRSPVMEWSASVASVVVNVPGLSPFTVPNRNMPVDGLTVLIKGEIWKAMDGIGISLASGAELKPSKVRSSPSLARYEYSSEGGDVITIEYAPADSGTTLAGGLKLTLTFPSSLIGDSMDLFFLTDLRPLKGPSEAVSYFPLPGSGMLASTPRVRLGVSTSSHIDPSGANRSDLNWFYKQGYGFRVESERGVVFVPERRVLSVLGPYRLRVSSTLESLLVILSENWPVGAELESTLTSSGSVLASQLRDVLSSLPEPKVTGNARDALRGRVAALLSFGIMAGEGEGRIYGEAGAHWFRETWFRDLFEGLLWSFRTLSTLGLTSFVRDQLELSIGFASAGGLIPNRLDWTSGHPKPGYESVDSTLLFHQLLQEYCHTFGEQRLLSRGLALLEKFTSAARSGDLGCVRLRDGALLSPANYSWIDSRADIDVDGVKLNSIPCRLPTGWLKSMLSDGLSPREIEAITREPVFLMPEVQSRFLLVLRGAAGIAEQLGADSRPFAELGHLSARALEDFMLGRAGDLPPNLVMFESGHVQVDLTPSSPALVALSLLKDEIPKSRLSLGYSRAVEELLVHRRMRALGDRAAPFGLIAQKRECQPYLGDRQYHGCVVWPRDTPYLIDVMLRLGHEEEVDGLLLNNLDCSISEGVPFYVNELYGLPLGRNPSPVESTADQPIPLKNPAQFWSTWCDPYLRWFLS